jgi:hypothetical protein
MKPQQTLAALALGTLAMASAADPGELKAYYETQKEQIAPAFSAPPLGSEIELGLVSGQTRKGILMKLGADAITAMSEAGDTMVYKRHMLNEATRARFFAEDFAHVLALERTREYKRQLLADNLAEEAANTHEGSISVSAKVGKTSEKTVEEDERENKQSGEKFEIRITTRTYTEVQKLDVTVSNPTTHPDTYTLECYFFAEPVSRGQPRREPKDGEGKPGENEGIKLQGKTTRTVTVPARSRQTITVESEPFTIEKVEVSGNREPRESGEEGAGYLVVLKHGSRVLDRKASAKGYMDTEWLHRFQ